MNEAYATSWKQAKPSPTGFFRKSRYYLRRNALYISSALNKKHVKKYLRCLYCHNVFNDQISDFQSILQNLQKIGQFVDTDTCIQMLLGNVKIDHRYFHLSFDDGFRNNFTNAVPILYKHKVPAVFFVPSSLVDADFENARKYCIETTKYKAVIEMLKWDDLRKMIDMGFEIGSHTKTHARFSAISENPLLMEDEISGSKKDLEANLDYKCRYISWPYGSLSDRDNKSMEIVKSAGYHACFGAFRGTIVYGITDPFSIPRHQFEVQWPVSHILYFIRGNHEYSMPEPYL